MGPDLLSRQERGSPRDRRPEVPEVRLDLEVPEGCCDLGMMDGPWASLADRRGVLMEGRGGRLEDPVDPNGVPWNRSDRPSESPER